jgi:hypothetical protein
MTLAPIRGAPPGAPIPDFPIKEPRVTPAEPTAAPASGDHPPISHIRQRQTPIEIGGNGITLTFRVIPELPAIARASMTIHIVADAVGPSPSHMVGFLRMSAANARAFLTDLRKGRSPIIATGDEDGGADRIRDHGSRTGSVDPQAGPATRLAPLGHRQVVRLENDG